MVRPDFERMLSDIDAGMVDTVLVWRTDRLTRQPGHLERFLDTCERRGVSLASVTEPFNIGTNSGLFMVRQFVGFASYESGVKAERVARKHAERGLPSGGPRGYGYCPDALTIQEDDAALIREAAGRVLAGKIAWAVGVDFGERGIKTATGKLFGGRDMGRLLRQRRIAGLRDYHGEIVGDAAWPAILDRIERLWRRTMRRRTP